MSRVKRTERGWAGHFCCARDCHFTRNTLLEYKDTKIVVSTVGMYQSPITKKYETIGYQRHFETMAFYAEYDGKYWDADVGREVSFDSPWAIDKLEDDDKANDMHEMVVDEIICKMIEGQIK